MLQSSKPSGSLWVKGLMMLSFRLDLILNVHGSLQQRSKWNPFSLTGAETGRVAAFQIIIGLKDIVHSAKNIPWCQGSFPLNNVAVL